MNTQLRLGTLQTFSIPGPGFCPMSISYTTQKWKWPPGRGPLLKTLTAFTVGACLFWLNFEAILKHSPQPGIPLSFSPDLGPTVSSNSTFELFFFAFPFTAKLHINCWGKHWGQTSGFMIIWIVCQFLCWNDDRWIIKTDTEDLSRVLIPIFAIFTSFFSLSHPALLLVQIITLTQSAQLGRSVGVHVFSWLPVRIEEFLTAGAMVAHSFPNSSILGAPLAPYQGYSFL